ncbi:MAG: hypothetical protein NZL83_03330 [Candidatus Absconditabacterales bacterium]|nr:hypothetical protein [Candidatus Absconditabacterales bacterium]
MGKQSKQFLTTRTRTKTTRTTTKIRKNNLLSQVNSLSLDPSSIDSITGPHISQTVINEKNQLKTDYHIYKQDCDAIIKHINDLVPGRKEANIAYITSKIKELEHKKTELETRKTALKEQAEQDRDKKQKERKKTEALDKVSKLTLPKLLDIEDKPRVRNKKDELQRECTKFETASSNLHNTITALNTSDKNGRDMTAINNHITDLQRRKDKLTQTYTALVELAKQNPQQATIEERKAKEATNTPQNLSDSFYVIENEHGAFVITELANGENHRYHLSNQTDHSYLFLRQRNNSSTIDIITHTLLITTKAGKDQYTIIKTPLPSSN